MRGLLRLGEVPQVLRWFAKFRCGGSSAGSGAGSGMGCTF